MGAVIRELAMWIPFIVWWGFFLFFKYWCPNEEIKSAFNDALKPENRPRRYPAALWKHHVAIVFALSLLWRVIFAFEYTYEAHIYIEALIPSLFAYPFLCRFFTSLRRLAICLLPLTVFVVIEQIKCVQFGQWTYCPLEECGTKFIFWGGYVHPLIEKSLNFGPDMPMIEIIFYPAYIIMTTAVAAIALSIFPRGWLTPKKSLAPVFPIVFGLTTSIMIFGTAWFFIEHWAEIKKGTGTIPYHALAALASNVMLWLGFGLLPYIRRLVRTRLFVMATFFSIIQTAIFEWYHASLQRHWIYCPENELASLPLFSVKFFRFPDLPSIGGYPYSWPIEEWCAYPAQYVFLGLMIVFFHRIMKVDLMRKEILHGEDE